MKVVILKRSDLSVMGYYDASAPNQLGYGGPFGDSLQTIHVGISNSLDYRACSFNWNEDGVSVNISEDAELKARLAAADQLVQVQIAIARATAFGQGLMNKFAAQNVQLGITQDGKTGEVLDKMGPIITALQSGSLYEAITRAKEITPDMYDSKYVTHDRIYAFINEIEAYLGLQLSL